ncbi:hypothetical protein LTSESEN_6129, partial [Salmonella enterica subsp. enterica serovar Senftenberg str. A4-543]
MSYAAFTALGVAASVVLMLSVALLSFTIPFCVIAAFTALGALSIAAFTALGVAASVVLVLSVALLSFTIPFCVSVP